MARKKKIKFKFPKLRKKRMKTKVVIKRIIIKEKRKQKTVGQVLKERIERRKARGIQ